MALLDRLHALVDTLCSAATGAPTASDPRAFATAMLLFEVAWADQQIDDAEMAQIRGALQRLYGLAPGQAEAVIAQASAAHAHATGVQSFTHQLNAHLSTDERIEVLTELWRLAFSDASLSRFEEHLVRRIADLLYVHHADYIAAKQRARASLAAAGFQPPPSTA